MTRITLATLPQASAQQVYDQVARHLLTQKRRSILPELGPEHCAYRGVDGLMCAAGCLISDDEYDPVMEEAGSWRRVVTQGYAPGSHAQLIGALQSLHDDTRNEGADWPLLLRSIAVYYGLSTAVIKRFDSK